MNISFFDGVNDGKFYSINAGKYDELGEEDIDISTEVEEEDDTDTCLNRFAALEKDASKLHMDLNNLRNEFKGSCKDWNNLSDTVDHMLNSIAEMKTIMDRADDRLNKRLNVISEANVVLTDKMNLIEKKLEVFKCIDILDRVTKLEEQVKPTVLEETKELEVKPSVLDDILDRVTKLEERYDTDDKLIDSLLKHTVDTDCKLSSLSDRVSKLDSKLTEHIDKYNKKVDEKLHKLGPKTESIIEDLVKYMGMSRKHTERPFESDKNDIQDDPVNHPKHYTDGKYECIDFIEEYGMITHIGTAIKYISRTGKKDASKYIEDLKKAFWYLHRYNTPQSMGHINVIDYCREKKLPMELTAVIIAISCEDYKGAEQILRDYITKITDKTPKAFEDEQSK